MSGTNTNGRPPRKSLATQLDRLDSILDGLADGLNEAVVTAVKEAVVVAVEAVLREVLDNPELQRRCDPSPSPRNLLPPSRGWSAGRSRRSVAVCGAVAPGWLGRRGAFGAGPQ